MRAGSAARWAEDELFNLKNAFDLQLKRLEVERCRSAFLRVRCPQTETQSDQR